MRRLRIVFTTVAGGAPALLVTLLAPSLDACADDDGSLGETASDGAVEARGPWSPTDGTMPDAGDQGSCVYVVELPPEGAPAEPAQLCAVPDASATSREAARVTLRAFSASSRTATGLVSVPPELEASVVGVPTLAVIAASDSSLNTMTTKGMTKVAGGFEFDATWAEFSGETGERLTIKATLVVACDDAATTTVESITHLDLCEDFGGLAWVSSGDTCNVCTIIAEMAPSPIVSDKQGDDLPLGRVIRLRVVEVARNGQHVLLFADDDAGSDARYEWRVSQGTLEPIADDVMLWTLPAERIDLCFGQVAVWNDSGAAVENFLWASKAEGSLA